MLRWQDVKEAELGREFDIRHLRSCCRAVYGGVAWPGKRPGFAVVLATSQLKQDDTGSYEICLVDEYESSDMRELVQQCGCLDVRWEPDLWVGDTHNGAAEEFIFRMNQDSERYFDLGPACFLDMQPVYPYILSTLKGMLGEKNRRLFLKDGKVINYLGEIEPGKIAELGRGDFPAIEALGDAVEEALYRAKTPEFTQTHTGDAGFGPERGKFDHLLRPGATDPGWDYDEDEEGWCHTV